MNFPLGFYKSVVLWPFFTAFVLTFICTPAIIKIAKEFNLVDDPNKRSHPAHTETRTIPRAGGLAIFLGIFCSVALFIPFSLPVVGILAGATILVLVGLIDDYADVNPYLRLFGANFLAAVLAVGAGAYIPYITNPFGGVIDFPFWIGILATILWIMWVINMVGWSGGVDGQMPGFVAISAVFIGLISLNQLAVLGDNGYAYWTVTAISFIVAGAYFGFLPWNFFPQKIMPGYSGKSLAGFMLATVAVLSVTKVGTAILVLGIPMIDALFVMTKRILSGKSPVYAGRDHLHHRLLDLGWSKPKIALFYWGVSAILGMVALNLSATQQFFAAVMLMVVFGAILLWLNYSFWSLKKPGLGNGLKTS